MPPPPHHARDGHASLPQEPDIRHVSVVNRLGHGHIPCPHNLMRAEQLQLLLVALLQLRRGARANFESERPRHTAENTMTDVCLISGPNGAAFRPPGGATFKMNPPRWTRQPRE